LDDVKRVGEKHGFVGNKFRFISLGDGMEQEAEEKVKLGAQRGHWVMLQNCHLLLNFILELESTVAEF